MHATPAKVSAALWQGLAKGVGDKSSVISKNQAIDKWGIVFPIRIASLALDFDLIIGRLKPVDLH